MLYDGCRPYHWQEEGVMKALMIYDTVSEAKVTGKVAEAVVEGLKEGGAIVDSRFVSDATNLDMKEYDLLVLGAPTMAWSPSKRMKEYLTGQGGDFSGKKAATFATQMESFIAGNGPKKMEKKLTGMKFAIAQPALIAFVVSENKVYKLKDGQLEKAKTWGKELAKK
jgi:menaquinone-dependent protoporphyrinogen IX oxidase